jgi:phenylacetate-CoA ligase
MPFIRYQLGDIASPSDDECPCGRGLPTFSLLQGRRDDFIVAEGTLIPPTRIVPLFFSLHDIDGFQVIQENLRNLKVKIVKGKGFSHQTLTTLHQNLKNVVGDSMEIIIEECEEIKEDREKMRAVISNVEKVL